MSQEHSSTDEAQENKITTWETLQPTYMCTPREQQFTPQQAEEFLERYMQRQAFAAEEEAKQPPPYTRILATPLTITTVEPTSPDDQPRPSTSAGPSSLLRPTSLPIGEKTLSPSAQAARFLASLQKPRPTRFKPPPTVSVTLSKEDQQEFTEFDIPSPVAPDLTDRQYENLVQALSILSDIIDYGSNQDRTRFTEFLKRSMYRQYERVVAPLQEVAQKVRNNQLK